VEALNPHIVPFSGGFSGPLIKSVIGDVPIEVLNHTDLHDVIGLFEQFGAFPA